MVDIPRQVGRYVALFSIEFCVYSNITENIIYLELNRQFFHRNHFLGAPRQKTEISPDRIYMSGRSHPGYSTGATPPYPHSLPRSTHRKSFKFRPYTKAAKQVVKDSTHLTGIIEGY